MLYYKQDSYKLGLVLFSWWNESLNYWERRRDRRS